jgi:divalent metal cation (Fe/Co/Zn/Cd) transporter
MKAITNSTDKIEKLYRLAFILAIFTIIYNIGEGIISVYIGYEDESLVLFGFGVDSFIEVISGLGIATMVFRIQKNPDSNRNDFERLALRITGFSFYILVIGLVISSIYNLVTNHKPETTLGGILISCISLVIMWALIILKTRTGKYLHSDAIIADAECARVCMYMSIILLTSSVIYHFFKIAYIDSIGTLGLSYFAFKEGKECFDKAKNNTHCSCNHSH